MCFLDLSRAQIYKVHPISNMGLVFGVSDYVEFSKGNIDPIYLLVNLVEKHTYIQNTTFD